MSFDENFLKILIVDDSAMLIERFVKGINLDKTIVPCQASNCKEALALFESFKPDVVLLDIYLPDGSGITLLEKMKTQNKNLIALMWSNYPTEQFKEVCYKAGAEYFFDKAKDIHQRAIFINTLKNKKFSLSDL